MIKMIGKRVRRQTLVFNLLYWMALAMVEQVKDKEIRVNLINALDKMEGEIK
ncbi:hypothetical protein LCGC14_0693720 [marine sediment metagenome]|uniref:Uncharacterized protein n=1 Tax=marine sediment metagenome TaxID=412755 RepID=A0A0F9T608_9ZZZZ